MAQEVPLGVEDPHVEVGHQHEDPLVAVRPTHPDVVELGTMPQGDRAVGVDPVSAQVGGWWNCLSVDARWVFVPLGNRWPAVDGTDFVISTESRWLFELDQRGASVANG